MLQIRNTLLNVFKSTNIFRNQYCTKPKTKITKKLGFIGDGNMSKAICKGLETKGLVQFSQIYVSSPYVKNLNVWKECGAITTTNNTKVAQECDVIFLAVKPHLLHEVLDSIIHDSANQPITDKLFVSILAGIPLKELEEKLSSFQNSRVIRVMPNTSMIVGEGCTVYCPGKKATEEDINLIKSILEVTGICQEIPEKMINAASALSSSGPAFVYLFIEALSDGGVRMGLHREMATKFAAQTVLGAAKMVLQTNKHMGILKDEVCSAGGMTIAGVQSLEKGAVRGHVMNAVEAAAKRADELAK